jgi:hypothetical protein
MPLFRQREIFSKTAASASPFRNGRHRCRGTSRIWRSPGVIPGAGPSKGKSVFFQKGLQGGLAEFGTGRGFRSSGFSRGSAFQEPFSQFLQG